jgi:hypothetical protein
MFVLPCLRFVSSWLGLTVCLVLVCLTFVSAWFNICLILLWCLSGHRFYVCPVFGICLI